MATISWTPDADGDWANRRDWSGGSAPGPADAVVLDTLNPHTITHSIGGSPVASLTAITDRLAMAGGVLRVAGTASLGAGLTLTGGSLVLVGGGAIAGGFVSSGGTLSLGVGTTTRISGAASFADATSLAGPGTLATNGATSIGADGSAVLLGGGLTWTNAGSATLGGSLTAATPAHIVNAAGATLSLTSDAAAILTSVRAMTLVNAGTLAKTGGTGASRIDALLTSTGTIAILSGTIELTANATLGGALTGAGTLELSGAANHVANLTSGDAVTLQIDSLAAVAVTGSVLGAVRAQHGTLLTSGTVTVAGPFALDGGTLGVAGLLTLSDASLLGGCTVKEPGTLATIGQTTVGADGLAIAVSHAVWSNGGALTLDSAIEASGDASIVNLAGGSFGLGGDAGGLAIAGGHASLANAGTLAKLAGSGVSTIGWQVSSTGTLAVASGTLDLAGGAAISGDISGGGMLLFGAGSVSVAAGTVVGVANLAVAGAAVTLGGGRALGLTMSSGTLAVAAGLAAATLAMSGGFLELQAGSLSIAGPATLSGGAAIDGPGTLATAGVTTLGADGSTVMLGDGATFANAGSVVATGALQCAGPVDVALINAAGGTFDLLTDAAGILGGPSTFSNSGNLAKLGGSAVSSVDSVLTSTGTITVAAGTLDLAGGGTIGGAVGGSGTLLLGGGRFAIAGGTTLQMGSLIVGGGSVALGGASGTGFALAGGLRVASAELMLAPGVAVSLLGAATFTDAATIAGAGALYTHGPVTIAGDGSSAGFADGLAWTNSGIVTALGQIDAGGAASVTFDNAAGATFDLGSDVAGIAQTGAASSFDNAGTLAKTGGGGTSSVFSSVDSTGTLIAGSGTLSLEFSAALSGMAGGVGGGRLLLVNGATTSGVLAITDDGLTASIQLSSSYASWFNGGAVSDAGLVVLGDAADSGPAFLYNAAGATWDLVGDDAGMAAIGQVQVTNAGTLAKTGGGGSSTVAFGFANSGLIDVASGTLDLKGTISGAGQLRIEGGSTLELGAALGTAQTLTMAGSGATLKLDQPASVAAPIQGLGAGDRIDLAGVAATGASISGTTLSVQTGGGGFTFVASASLSGLVAQVASDGSGGSLIALSPAALLADLLPGGPVSSATGPWTTQAAGPGAGGTLAGWLAQQPPQTVLLGRH